MAVYGVTDAGFVLKTLSVIRTEVEDYQRLHVDASLDTDDEEPLSQVNLSLINQHAILWELAQAVYASHYPDSASGQSLVQVAAITGTAPNDYSKTQVTGQVTMNPNKELPVGSVAHLQDKPNSRFLTTTLVPADPVGGTFDVVFQAENFGTIAVDAGELNTIAEPLPGWTAVTNADAGTPGSQPEEDDELRQKREVELAAQGKGNLAAVIADVSRVDSVITVNGFENVKDYWVNDIPPKTIKIVVRGGDDFDVAQAILDSKSGGIDTIGTTTVDVPDDKGTPIPISFTRGSALTLYVTMSLEVLEGWSNTEDKADVRSRVAAYANGLALGDDVVYDKLKSVIYDNDHVYKVTSLYIGFSAAPTGTADLSTAADEYVTSDVANIDIPVPA